MGERVKLHRAASEAINALWEEGYSKYDIIEMFINFHANPSHKKDVRAQALQAIPSFEKLLHALMFGHDPIESKEDIIRRNYKYGNLEYREAVIDTLNVLEIIVPEVNDR